jgi:membrane-anchored protein YejM (alkaline phosphatase superfamily)
MQLHKQFIEPFPPMNNLQKLLETDGYQSYISTDPLLRTVLAKSPSITGLDERTHAWSDLDFVATLKELETKIDERTDRAKPIFAYSQPQNVHTITLARSKIPGGRKAVSIYELGRMDTAFGEFLGFLRQRGLYDNSIVILTADHGDSYGEYGRYGHSDFLFPEIIRIPMIVHLPEEMRKQYVVDTKQPAFTTDITPSLFYLLGHKPILNNEIFGRPIFTQTAEEATAYKRSHYLIVCSYAPVYAILGAQAQSLFIVDAVHSKSYYYNLIDDPLGTRSHLSKPVLKENEALIRHDVGLIDDFYRWHPPQE